MATIILSSTLTQFAKQQNKLEIPGKTLFAVLLNMIQEFPNLRPHLFDINGGLTEAMSFYINEEIVDTDRWHNLPVKKADVVSILLSGRKGQEEVIRNAIEDVPMRNESRDRLKLVQ